MIEAGIKDVKNNLSRYLARVKGGEEVLITDRGKPVARIVRENRGNKPLRVVLRSLTEKGVVTLPSRGINKDNLTAIEVSGKPVSEMVIEDRR